MIRPYLLLSVALFVVSVPEGLRAQDGRLAGLNEVGIIIEPLDSKISKLGLTEDDLRNQVFVYLQGKLPRIKVYKNATSSIYIRVTGLIFDKIKSYAMFIEVMVYDNVIIQRTKKQVVGLLWDSGYLMKGPNNSVANHVREILETRLTEFAADWYRDNPTK